MAEKRIKAEPAKTPIPPLLHQPAITAVVDHEESNHFVGSTPPWKRRYDTLLEKVEVEEQCVAITAGYLQELKLKLQGHATEVWSSKKWVDRIETIESKEKKCRVTIGFVGSTGTGKSTLISALVGQANLVPIDHGSACTSVIVELLWNPKDEESSKFEAKVTFVDPKDWQKELDKLYADIAAEKAEEEDEDADLDPDLARRIEEMISKIRAVYPFIKNKTDLNKTSVEKLMAHQNVQQLGKETVINGSELKKFSSQIRPFIDSKAGQGKTFALWPLVKLVRVYTKSELLKNGIVLVDIPGNSDANAARDSLAKNYMKKLSVTCVLARANRAPDDKSAHDLIMSKGTERNLRLDGNWRAEKLCFLVVRTDESLQEDSYLDKHTQLAEDVDHLLVIQSRQKQHIERIQNDIVGLRESLSRNEKLCRSLTTEIQQHFNGAGYANMPSSKKRKFTADGDEDDSILSVQEKAVVNELRKLRSQRSITKQQLQREKGMMLKKKEISEKIQSALWHMKCALRRACIDHRNELAAVEIKANYKRVADETGTESSPRPLRVFCISALKYLDILNGTRDYGFPRDVNTGIPALKKWLVETTLESRHQNAKSYLVNVEKFEMAIKAFARDTSADHKIPHEQREELEENFKKKSEELIQSFCGLHGSIGSYLQNLARINVCSLMTKNENDSANTANTNVREFGKHPMYWSTYRAINAHYGQFTSSKGIPYNWNEELAGIYLDPLIKPWNHVFKGQLPAMKVSYDADALKRLAKFADDVTKSGEAICPAIVGSLQSLKESIMQMKESLREYSLEVFHDAIPDAAMDIHRLVVPQVLDSMTPGYETCAAIRGKNTFNNMQTALRGHIKSNGKTMYKLSSVAIKEGLERLSEDTAEMLDAGLAEALTELNELHTLMLENHTESGVYIETKPAQSVAKLNLQKDIADAFRDLAISLSQNIQLLVEEEEEPLEVHELDLDNLGDNDVDDLDFEDDDEGLQEIVQE